MRPVPAAAMIALVAGGLSGACTGPADPAQLAAVERMIRETEDMAAELDAQDTGALRHMASLFEAERPSIERRFRDTLLPQEAEVLGNYFQAMGTRLPAVLAERRAGRARIDSTALRLRNLRHDMEHGLLGGGKRQRALMLEQRWNARLRQDLDSITMHTQALIRDRKAYRAAIDPWLHP